MMRRIRVLLVKGGLDGHDRGVKVIMMGLRDEGMEVIYSGVRQTVERMVKIAVEEDVDVVGLSSLSGAHMYHFTRVAEMLGEQGMDRVLVIGGGVIPEEDIPLLKQKGVRGVFGPGTSIEEIAGFIRGHVKR